MADTSYCLQCGKPVGPDHDSQHESIQLDVYNQQQLVLLSKQVDELRKSKGAVEGAGMDLKDLLDIIKHKRNKMNATVNALTVLERKVNETQSQVERYRLALEKAEKAVESKNSLDEKELPDPDECVIDTITLKGELEHTSADVNVYCTGEAAVLEKFVQLGRLRLAMLTKWCEKKRKECEQVQADVKAKSVELELIEAQKVLAETMKKSFEETLNNEKNVQRACEKINAEIKSTAKTEIEKTAAVCAERLGGFKEEVKSDKSSERDIASRISAMEATILGALNRQLLRDDVKQAELEGSYNKLLHTCEGLKQTNTKLLAEHDKISGEKKTIEAENVRLERECEILRQHHNIGHHSEDKFVTENMELRSQIAGLQAHITELQNNNQVSAEKAANAGKISEMASKKLLDAIKQRDVEIKKIADVFLDFNCDSTNIKNAFNKYSMSKEADLKIISANIETLNSHIISADRKEGLYLKDAVDQMQESIGYLLNAIAKMRAACKQSQQVVPPARAAKPGLHPNNTEEDASDIIDDDVLSKGSVAQRVIVAHGGMHGTGRAPVVVKAGGAQLSPHKEAVKSAHPQPPAAAHRPGTTSTYKAPTRSQPVIIPKKPAAKAHH